MKIFVCVKHVPDTAMNITVIGESGYDDSIKFVMNPYDEYALEEAVRIVEKEGGEVVVVTVGNARAVQTVRGALAVGAHRGVHVVTDAQFLDSFLTSRALEKIMHLDGLPDLILTGKESVDSEGGQTHYRLAAALDMPVASEVSSLNLETRGKAVVEREIGGGEREVMEISLPCVIGVTKGINQPRYPKMMDVMKAKNKEVKSVPLPELGVEGLVAAAELERLIPVPERGEADILEGEVRGAVAQMVRHLREEAKVL